MNKRIRELAEQAGIDFFNSTDPEYCGREYCEAWAEQQQKFAELIVRECACVPTDMWGRGELPADQASRLQRRILEHFGVSHD